MSIHLHMFFLSVVVIFISLAARGFYSYVCAARILLNRLPFKSTRVRVIIVYNQFIPISPHVVIELC